jgi:hypothetical protein
MNEEDCIGMNTVDVSITSAFSVRKAESRVSLVFS